MADSLSHAGEQPTPARRAARDDFEVCPVGSLQRLAVLDAIASGTLITAVFRPVKGDVALLAERGNVTAIPVEAARVLHDQLDEALRLADCADAPIKAVG